MQDSQIVTLVTCILPAARGYYLGYVNPPRTLRRLWQSTFVVMTFLLIPTRLSALLMQANATRRLSAIGVTPHPAIQDTAGVAYGTGQTPRWMFIVSETGESLLNFYTQKKNDNGWRFVCKTDTMMISKTGIRAC